MEDEQEDIKKMTDFINQQKLSYQNNFQLEFEDFISFKQNSSDPEFEDELFDEEKDPSYQVNINNLFDSDVSDQGVIFTEEEQKIIESCTDPDLKRMLILNRSKNMQLIKLHKKMQDFLQQNDQEIEEQRVKLQNLEASMKQQNQQTFVWKLAAPYFKDKKFFPSPLNEDALRKRSSNELAVYDLASSPKWTPIEFDRLTNAVRCNYNINRQNNLVSKINTLKVKMQKEDVEDKSVVEEIVNLKEQLEELKNDDQLPPLNSNEFINWYKVAETFLRDKHTASECQSVWHMLVHPQINKSEWTDEENKKLEAIAKRHSYQNWDDIACELSTNRTGFTTCLHYFSKLCDKFKKSKFTPEEDSFLLDVIDMYKVGDFIPWNKVVCHFSDRSRHQLYHRYTYFLSQNHVKRGKFSEAEDILLVILVNKFGRNFKKCAEFMPHRSQVQLKSRYNSNLQRHIRKGTFTTEDDKMIYHYAKDNGEKSWSGLTAKLNRCNAQIRQRYKLIKTFLQENPESSIADIPKRRHRYDEVNESQYNFLNYMADQYRDVDYIPTLQMIEDSLQVELSSGTSKSVQNKTKGSVDKSEVKLKNIDSMLTDFFTSSTKIKSCTAITEANLNEATENVEEVLKLLNVKLDVPKDLECDAHLDNIDLEILERISKKTGNSNSSDDRLIPPNINTLVGLRSLIIKHKEYKSHQSKYGNTSTDEKNLSSKSNRDEVLSHRKLFSKRFDALFDWSAILSLEKPNQVDEPEPSTSNGSVPSRQGRTYGKRPNTGDAVPVKKRKISMSSLTNLAQNPQLKLVDKHVVENLIKKNNIHVIRLEPLSASSGVGKPVFASNRTVAATVTASDEMGAINNSFSYDQTQIDNSFSYDQTQVDNSFSYDQTQIDNSFSYDETEDSLVTDSDVQDVETLNVVLKTMKSESSNDPGCSSEEYEAIKDDVQLLKEVLQYEKVKVKSEPDGF